MSEPGTHARVETIWVPGHRGWTPPKPFTPALIAITVVLGAFFVLYVVLLVTDPAPASKALAAVFVAGFAVGVWAARVQLRGMRPRTVRAAVSSDGVRFGRPEGMTWPLRAAAICGVALLAAWAWTMLSVPADDLLGGRWFFALPVVAALVIFGAGRAWLPGRDRHALTLTPESVVLRLSRDEVVLPWEIILQATLVNNRVTILMADGSTQYWGARDLASDPAILAELISFYAASRAARSEIGAATLQRLRDGTFSGADDPAERG